ncbi:MAG: hypothetical protein KGJ72_11560 [Gammaproteobacteria bacterium]|nr:hypothetical protein [Gammaproteobacteria bacterium]
MMSPLNRRVAAATAAALLSVPVLCAAQTQSDPANNLPTATPIKHVILIIGENRTFDEVFGTYKPREGQHVWNLRSEGILNADGSPGPNFYKAQQWLATDTSGYSIHPGKTAPYAALEAISTSGTPASAPFTSAAAAQAVEPALPADYYPYLADGGSGLPSGTTIDPRFPGDLPNGPFDITHYLSYDDYAGSPVHRFFQMWQQLDCNVAVATTGNPSGCQNDLFAWVEASTGAGSNGKPQPAGYDQPGHHEGPVAMGMYNAAQGDFPYFTQLANAYAVSDNYHQAVMGGTGANHLAIGYGTTIYYADANGNPATPPANQIENPDPQPGTNNFYSQDGYGGGSYVECVDGHPASSKGELLEGFARKIIDMVKANPSLWKDTAIMITADEGGGYYDSGYVQPIDFFGDGTRIPMIVVSPYSRHVGVVHTYDDHVSFDKFVEANWKVGTISRWSRDNLPDPVASRKDPYVPRNSPAIGDMMDMFHFDHDRDGDRD